MQKLLWFTFMVKILGQNTDLKQYTTKKNFLKKNVNLLFHT